MDQPITTNAVETPYEVIQNIMDCLVFPRIILPFTFRPLIFSSGHPQYKLKPMIHVCKSWYYAILPLLYRDVVVRKSSQLAGLVKKIQEPNSSFHKFIKSVEIGCVPPDELGSIEFRCGIEILLQTCPNITTFAYVQSYIPSPHLHAHVYPLLTGPITHLHLEWVTSHTELASALRLTSVSLLSLFVSFADLYNEAPLKSAGPVSGLSFPRLHTLCIPQDNLVFTLLMKWDMPNLTTLLLWLECFHPVEKPLPSQVAPSNVVVIRPYLRSSRLTYDNSVKFFKKFGSKLKVLDMYRNDDASARRLFLPAKLQRYLPTLEHLILHHHQNAGSVGRSLHTPFPIQQFKHPNVKWIDIWAEESVEDTKKCLESLECFPLANKSDSDDVDEEPACEDFPNLRGIRIFPPHLASWSHLPLLIPPSFSSEPEVFEFPPAREVVDMMGWVKMVGCDENDSDPDDEDYEPEDSDEDEENDDELDLEQYSEEDDPELQAELTAELKDMNDEGNADSSRKDMFLKYFTA